MGKLKIVECPRDAMQGIESFIPTKEKISYINQLLKVGFDTLDFGSFVSPKAIPQLKDTAEVLEKLDLSNLNSKLLAIIANERGAIDACNFQEINVLGYPFSVSETFQKRNSNASIEESIARVEKIAGICDKNNKELLLYLSMGFGNPYGDPYHEDILSEWILKLSQFNVKTFAVSDTIGVSEPDIITRVFTSLIPEFPNLQIGAHLHTTPDTWKEKVEAAYKSGCRRFDGAIAGYGGCPMAEDELTGNMPTEKLIEYFIEKKLPLELNLNEFERSKQMAAKVFPLH